MDKKAKFILIGFAGILLISLFISLQTYNAKQSVERERDILKRDNAALIQQVNEGLKDNQRLQERLNTINLDLDRAAKEKEELQRKLELVNKEKTGLIEKLRAGREVPQIIESEKVPLDEDAYWGGILKAKTELEFQIENVRNELKAMQINNEQLEREKSTLELEFVNLNREKQDLKRQLEYNQKLIDSVSAGLARERTDKFQIEETFKPLKSENVSLRRQLKTLSVRKVNLERKIIELQKENRILEKKLDEMSAFLKESMLEKAATLKEKAEALGEKAAVSGQAKEESIELTPIVVRPPSEKSEQPQPAGLSGNILAVNKENNFVIIDLGEDSGVKVGDKFGVYREDQEIAGVEVIQIRKSIAACDITKESTPIKVGDAVK